MGVKVALRSYRSKLQAAFVSLGMAAVAVTGWESSETAGRALRDATYERLTAIAETKRREVERYFQDVANHVIALSSDESAIEALEQFELAWPTIPPMRAGQDVSLRGEYAALPQEWYPRDPRVQTLQAGWLASNPHPAGRRHQLLHTPGLGKYGDVHARFHPTLQRYQAAFGFYDTFIIGRQDSRILYTVTKEIDLGVRLEEAPYDKTSLARLAVRALQLPEPESFVVEDYEPYLPSQSQPAAFFGAPIWRRGEKIGVLAIQIAADELNRVMTSEGNWRGEGMGETGQAYIAGADNRLRSEQRSVTGGGGAIARKPGEASAILNAVVPGEVADSIRSGRSGTHLGHDFRNVPVLRSHVPLNISGLDWTLIAEIEAAEALRPIAVLRSKLLAWSLGIALIVLAAATLLARSVTRPVLALSAAADRVGRRDFDATLPVPSDDEIGRLAISFNRMMEDLKRTTVSKRELEVMAARLISVAEDERARIARELHDDLSQRLAAAAIELGRLQQGAPVQRDDLTRIKAQVVGLADDVHGISRRLHTSTLDDVGLTAAIEMECRSFFERGGPPVEFTVEGECDGFGRDLQLALYRIVQEALRNIQRHSGADEVSVTLRRTTEGAALDVRDNGRGFDARDRNWRRGVGLASMQERANALGGRCTIESGPGTGTRIAVTVPIETTIASDDEKATSAAGRRPSNRPGGPPRPA